MNLDVPIEISHRGFLNDKPYYVLWFGFIRHFGDWQRSEEVSAALCHHDRYSPIRMFTFNVQVL
jgi:hypothetical protein